MIRFVDEWQAFECTRCGEMEEVSRYVLADQFRRLTMRERLEKEHKDCKAVKQ